MPRAKTLTEEEKRDKKNEYERRRKEKIRNDPVLREQYRQKERERYARRKAAGLPPRSKLDIRSLQILRRKNRISANAYYRRKKAKAAARLINPSTETDQIDSHNTTERENSLTIRPNTSAGDLTLEPRGSNSAYENLDTAHQITSRAKPALQINTSMSSYRVLRSMTQNVDVDDIESNIPSFFVRSSSPQNSEPRSPCITPSLSSIQSAETTPCSSPASIASIEFKRDFKAKFRKYQKCKSNQINDLREKLTKIAKQKAMFKKRCQRLSEFIKTSPKSIPKLQSYGTSSNKKDNKQKRILSIVVKFYEDDENSIMCPGKKDTVTKGGVQKQKRLLTDTVKNLHLKYVRSGYPPISYVTFARMKPFWVKQPDLNKRNTCLCGKHDNMNLLITTLKTNNIIKENTISAVLNSMCCDKENVACLMRNCQDCKNKTLNYQEFDNTTEVAHYAWEKNKSNYFKNGVEKTSVRIEKVRKFVKPLDLITIFEKNVTPFMKHCGNIKNQSQAINNIKQNMSVNDCVIHIDFSENYLTKYGSEIQAVHFGGSRKQITLHTAVIYLKLDEQTTKTQSFCTISSSLRHDAAAVWAHIIPILGEIEKTAPQVCNLHIVSDSPSSQYRNKKILYIISQLALYCPQLTHIVWNYCECGHGKGAPDGVGGLLKRTADKVVSFGNDIPDIDSLVNTLKTKLQGVKIEVVQDYEVTEKDWLLPKNIKTFPGTMQVHQVIWNKQIENRLALRRQSCTQPECQNNAIRCVHGKHLGFHDLVTNNNIAPQQHDAVAKSKPRKTLPAVRNQSTTKLMQTNNSKSSVNLTKLTPIQMSDILVLPLMSVKNFNVRNSSEDTDKKIISGLEQTNVLETGKGKFLAVKSEMVRQKISTSKSVATPKILKDQLLISPKINCQKTYPMAKVNSGPSTSKLPKPVAIVNRGPSTSKLLKSSNIEKELPKPVGKVSRGSSTSKLPKVSKIDKEFPTPVGKVSRDPSTSKLPKASNIEKELPTSVGKVSRGSSTSKLPKVSKIDKEFPTPVGKVSRDPSTSKLPKASKIDKELPTSVGKVNSGTSTFKSLKASKTEKKLPGSTINVSNNSLLTHYENYVAEDVIPSCSFFDDVDSKMFSENEKSIDSDLSEVKSILNESKLNEYKHGNDANSSESDYDIF